MTVVRLLSDVLEDLKYFPVRFIRHSKRCASRQTTKEKGKKDYGLLDAV